MEKASSENRLKPRTHYRKGTFAKNVQSLTLSRTLMRKIDERTTPYFQFDLTKINKNIGAVKSLVQPDEMFYAVKCNSLEKVLETVGNAGCGFEINNKNEWLLLERLGLSELPMINSSPISSAEDVRFLYAKGVRMFCFDSKEQVDNLSANAPGADVYVRLFHGNRECRFKLNRLGADFPLAMELVTYARKKKLNPVGVTFHVGSQCRDSESWESAIRQSALLFEAFPCLKILNLGGGFPVRYHQYIPSLNEIGATIQESLDKYFKRRPKIYVEPGRFLVGDSAFTCTSVLQVREGSPISRAVVDMSVFSGFMEILEIKDGFHYRVSGEAVTREGFRRYQLGGPTCAGTDVICNDILLPELYVDFKSPHLSSRIYFANTGAYTLDYIAWDQRSGFNGSRIPRVYFTGEEGDYGMAV